ncbi:hypothetical protein HZC34_05680 [Candidatus Saganbacteria bacterium]|nr:hypothetical protein [Candidatus Saganbacteria bacterium]
MNIGKAFGDSWGIFTKNLITIILAFIVVGVLGILTLGILLLPLFVGFQMMFVKAKRGEQISLNDVFSQIKNFWRFLLCVIIIGLTCSIFFLVSALFFNFGYNLVGGILVALGIITAIYFGVSWMFAFLIIADKGMPAIDSLKASKMIVSKNNFFMHLLMLILVSIVGNSGSYALMIGILLTFPLAQGALACAYADESK